MSINRLVNARYNSYCDIFVGIPLTNIEFEGVFSLLPVSVSVSVSLLTFG